MIHGYHVIWGTYGFWLPNDPRGSWSDFVYAWELARFGRATKSIERSDIDPEKYATWRAAAREALKYPPVTLTGQQALEAANGFSRLIEKSRVMVWACSILPEHVHFVFGRHRYKIESVANLLKGEATRRLVETGMHPITATRRVGCLRCGEKVNGKSTSIPKKPLKMPCGTWKRTRCAKASGLRNGALSHRFQESQQAAGRPTTDVYPAAAGEDRDRRIV